MKSKHRVEVLRDQINSSLLILSNYFGVKYSLSETEDGQVSDKVDDKKIPIYGLMIEMQTTVDNQVFNRRLFYRRYEVRNGRSLNDVKSDAYRELFDILIGSFLIQATKSDDSTLEKVSKVRVIE